MFRFTLTRLALAAMTLARLALALGMMPYGVSKLVDFQFQVDSSNYARPLGELPGTILTWAFLGYSPVFQALLGVFEVVPAVLLLFARTRRLGALLMFPVTLNVAMINYFLDLWPATRLISGVFLGLNLFLILYDWRLYRDLLARVLAKPEPIADRRLRIASKVLGFVVPAAVIAMFAVQFYSQIQEYMGPITDFVGRRQINRAGTWRVTSVKIGGVPVGAAENALLYFDFSHVCVYSDGTGKRTGRFEAKNSDHTFRLKGVRIAPGTEDIEGTYRVDGARLVMEGRSAGRAVEMVLRREGWK